MSPRSTQKFCQPAFLLVYLVGTSSPPCSPTTRLRSCSLRQSWPWSAAPRSNQTLFSGLRVHRECGQFYFSDLQPCKSGRLRSAYTAALGSWLRIFSLPSLVSVIITFLACAGFRAWNCAASSARSQIRFAFRRRKVRARGTTSGSRRVDRFLRARTFARCADLHRRYFCHGRRRLARSTRFVGVLRKECPGPFCRWSPDSS